MFTVSVKKLLRRSTNITWAFIKREMVSQLKHCNQPHHYQTLQKIFRCISSHVTPCAGALLASLVWLPVSLYLSPRSARLLQPAVLASARENSRHGSVGRVVIAFLCILPELGAKTTVLRQTRWVIPWGQLAERTILDAVESLVPQASDCHLGQRLWHPVQLQLLHSCVLRNLSTGEPSLASGNVSSSQQLQSLWTSACQVEVTAWAFALPLII